MKVLFEHIIKPSGLTKKDKNHGYEFYSVDFIKSDSKTVIHIPSTILYFRNSNKKVYGKIDYSKFATSQNIRAIATKVIKNENFRKHYLIVNPDEEIFLSEWR